jgi:hypothetical protein
VAPKWWQLYLTFPLLIGLFFLDTHLNVSVGEHQLVQFGSVLAEFLLVQVWLRANASALRQMDDEGYYTQITVTELPARHDRQAAGGRRPLLPAPEAEIKGVLSDTFEMEAVDAGSRSREKVPQEVHKVER